MTRFLLALLAFAGIALAHGGTFRPPPGFPPRDPARPGGGLTPTTPRGNTMKLAYWERWWGLNAGRHLRLRERMIERTVITGPGRKKSDFVARAEVRARLIPILAEALDDHDAEVRILAATTAARLKATELAPRLRELVEKDKDRSVRDAAVFALAFLRDKQLAPWLKQLALAPKASRHQRGFAVLGLGELGETEFLLSAMLNRKGFLQGSNSAVDELRACAAIALGRAGSPLTVGSLVKLARDESAPRNARGIAASYVGMARTPIATPDVLEMVRDIDLLDLVRCGGAISVGNLVKPEELGVLDLLGKIAQRDKHGGMRALLFLSLGRVGGPRAAEHIHAEMVGTQEQTMRGFCYLAYSFTGVADAGEKLLDAFAKRKNFSERAACALGLGLCAHKAAASLLRDQVKKGQAGIADYSLVALGLMDDKEAVPLAQAALGKVSNPQMVRAAAIALALLRRNSATGELVDQLSRAKSSVVLNAIAHALGEIGTERAIDPLLAIYRDKKRPGNERAAALNAAGRIADADPISLFARYAFDYNFYCVSETLELVVTVL